MNQGARFPRGGDAFPRRHAAGLLFSAWLIAAFLSLRFSPYGLTGIEAYYWDWSRSLDWGYCSKPPFVAYTIRAFTLVLGPSEWAMRSGAFMFYALALTVFYHLVRDLTGDRKAAFAGFAMALSMSAPWGLWFVMKTDGPLAFFWILTMYAFQRAVKGSALWWCVTGLAMSGAVLSKYTALLLLVSLAAYLLLVERQWLRTPFPYIALGLVLAGISGVVFWNYSHDWPSLRHTMALNRVDPATDSPAKAGLRLGRYLVMFFAMQGVVGAFSLATAIHLIRRRRADRRVAFLLLCFLSTFLAYALVSLRHESYSGWPIHASWALAAGFGWLWSRGAFPSWTRPVLVLGIVMGLVSTPAVPWMLGDNAGRVIGGALSAHVTGDAARDPFIFSDTERYSAWCAYYTKGRPRTYTSRTGRIDFQYDIWGGWEALVGRDALLVLPGSRAAAEDRVRGLVEAGAFRAGRVLTMVDIPEAQDKTGTCAIIKLEGYAGGKT